MSSSGRESFLAKLVNHLQYITTAHFDYVRRICLPMFLIFLRDRNTRFVVLTVIRAPAANPKLIL
jgi:hypothetical protein